MPDPICRQLWGQQFRNGTATQVWIFAWYADAAAVDAKIKLFAADGPPLVWSGLPVSTDWQIEEIGPRLYRVTVNYAARAGSITEPTGQGTQQGHGGGGPEELPFNVSFEIQTGQQRITQAYARIAGGAPGAAAPPDNGGAVNVKDGEVEGCDVPSGTLVFSLSAKFPAAVVTGAYLKVLEELCTPRPKLNADTFLGYPPETVLIQAARIGKVSANGFREAEFAFAVKRSVSLIPVATSPLIEILPPAGQLGISGWAYVSVTYRPVPVAAGGVTRQLLRPVGAEALRVFEAAPYAPLLLDKFRTPPEEEP